MLVKNIIKKSADFLGYKNIVKYLNEEIELNSEIEYELNNFLIGVNMINNNIASNYIELCGKSQVVVNSNMLIPYNSVSSNVIIEVKKITTLAGNEINFCVYPDGINVDGNGSVIVYFTYFPSEVGLGDSINHYLKVNEIIFAMGVVGEYLYIKGAIDNASIWDKRFKQNMYNLVRPKRNLIMPAKRWE